MEISRSFEITFHGTEFIITITADSERMALEAEEARTGSRWRGDYSSKYIEDVTQKTGNFKKFVVFVKMLIGSLENATESVFVDLLTYQDLEVLKTRKDRQALSTSNQSHATSSGPTNSKLASKRYLILTYAVEFDRVHYPLPLTFDENPDPVSLQTTIYRLRQEIESMRSLMPKGEINVTQILQENERLKAQVQKMEHIQSVAGNQGNRKGAVEIDTLVREKERLENDIEEVKFESSKEVRRLKKVNDDLQDKLDQLRGEMDGVIDKLEAEGDERLEMKTVKRNNDQLTQDLERAQNAARRYKKDWETASDSLEQLKILDRRQKARIKQVESELETALKSRGTSGTRQTSVPRSAGYARNTPSTRSPASSASRPTAARRSPANSRNRTPPNRAAVPNRGTPPNRPQGTPPGHNIYSRNASQVSRGGSAGSRGSSAYSRGSSVNSSDNESRRRQSPYNRGSPNNARRSPGSAGSRASQASSNSTGSRRRSPGNAYVSPYGQRRRAPAVKNAYLSDSDDEKKRPGPRVGRRDTPPGPDVGDIDARLNRLQDLLKYAKS